MKTLLLSPPSFDGFDGGAGSRYQAKREITSFWYPTWLAQPAALIPGSKLVDAPPHGQTVEDAVERMYRQFYFRPKAIIPIVWEMLTDRQMMVRRLREGVEFFSYLRERHQKATEHGATRQVVAN